MTWWITDTSIGQRLKFIRRFRRLTQKELGLLMGYSEKTADVRIAQYEKNARTPNAETTAKLAEVLKVSPAVFSPTICASREDLLQSMYCLFRMKGGGDIYDCETEYARSRMEQKLGVITVEEFLEKHRNRHGMNVDATQTGIVFQYHQVQMIVGISCLVVVFQDVLNQGRYRFQIFQTETSLIRIDYHKLITCLELQPSTQKLFNVELISLIKV